MTALWGFPDPTPTARQGSEATQKACLLSSVQKKARSRLAVSGLDETAMFAAKAPNLPWSARAAATKRPRWFVQHDQYSRNDAEVN
jgi:hypothetical protein